jgi:FtsH-binding integral membrane protein
MRYLSANYLLVRAKAAGALNKLSFIWPLDLKVSMTSQDHNRTIVIIYSFLGLVLAGAAIIWLGKDVRRNQNWLLAIYKDAPLIAAAIVSTCLLFTVYGMLRRRRWARVLALVTTVFYVWIFPLGTLLAVYIWWFLHSEGAKQLYARSVKSK